MLSAYTSADEIRAVLGVSADELEDSTISLQVYEFGLLKELRSVDSTLISSFLTASAVDAGSRSDAQAQFIESVHLFSTYAVARHLCTSLPMFSPKEISDSKASMVRFSTGSIEATTAMVEQQFGVFRTYLTTSLAKLNDVDEPTKVTRSFVSRAALSINPVTGS
jgi:hypothetical protein